MNQMTPLDDATRRQRDVSDPGLSAFVTANAGSGKTHVLVQRIIRLLLDGVEPSRILALTYTKAAAANMATRVFETLGRWVSKTDAELADTIEAIDGMRPDAGRVALARRLFARAIETPGGLKIQTIHAFCERLLHLFPFEANVAARFEAIDDMVGALWMEAARRDVLLQAASGRDRELQQALALVTSFAGETTLNDLLKQALQFRGLIAMHGATSESRAAYAEALGRALGLRPGETVARIDAEFSAGALTAQDCRAAIAMLHTSSSNDQKLAERIRLALDALNAGSPAWQDLYQAIFFKTDGDLRKKLVTDGIAKNGLAITARLLAEHDRVPRLVERRLAALAVERSRALLTVADAVLTRYEETKLAHGALDFDDMIERTQALLSRSDARWVLFKLDRGIDHLLIDEAQDTSPRQWAILRELTDAFFDNADARLATRTIFAVGDPKQSIYSFQGAEPASFKDNEDHFKRQIARVAEGNRPPVFKTVELKKSFRSAMDILEAVDTIFKPTAHHKGLERDPRPPVHEGRDDGLPGLVEIWPLKVHEDAPDEEDWTAPLDSVGRDAPVAQLARDIARTIAGWIAPGSKERLTGQDPVTKARVLRPIRAGDILILVRKRGALFETMIRALKDAGVPVAGADQLNLTQHIAVMDLMALGHASLLPDDDLTLATVLKSPLFGLSDDDLIKIAPKREGSLLASLERQPRFASVAERLALWRAMARQRGPFGFYAAVLGQFGGRSALIGRLGAEAGDAIDAFLTLALQEEQHETPSLQLFLDRFNDAELKIKRDMEAGGDAVRVMTVHGSKGLEAPIVFLPDTCSVPDKARLGPIQLLGADGPEADRLPVWSLSEAQNPPVIRAAKDAALERAFDEYRRLLYVALTRARERLYIAGVEGKRKRSSGNWYDMIAEGLADEWQPVPPGEGPEGARRRQKRRYQAGPEASPAPTRADEGAEPDWLRRPATPEEPPLPPLRPSGALDAADRAPRPLDGPFARHARRVGSLVHRLLEVLPDCTPARRAEAGRALVRARGKGLAESEQDRVLADVLRLMAEPDLAPLFGPASRAEVAVAGRLPLGPGGAPRAFSGQVDRIAITPEAVLIADYKTTSSAPRDASGLDPSHVRQVALYRALIAPLYPEKGVKALIVFTGAARSVVVPAEMMDAALAGMHETGF